MFSNDTTKLLDKMSDKEHKALSLFIENKYFNNRSEVVELLRVVLKLLYNNKNEAIAETTAEKAVDKVKEKAELVQYWFTVLQKKDTDTQKASKAQKEFDMEKVDDNFNTAMSKLKALIFDFFVVNHIQTNPLLKKRYLLEELRKRNLKEFIKPEEYHPQENKTLQSTTAYSTNWQIEDNIDRYYEAKLYRNPTVKHNIEPAAQALDAAFLVNKLRYMCNAFNHNRTLGIEQPKLSHGEQFALQWLEHNTHYTESYSLLNTYHLLWKMLQDSHDCNLFYIARLYVESHQTTFDPLELDTIYSLLTNYALRKNNAGEKEFAFITMQLYQNGLEKGYFYKDNITMSAIYKNIIKLSIQCNQVDNAILFLEKLKNHPNIEKALYTYCLAVLNFQNGRYEKVIEDIKPLQFNDNYNKIDNHILLLRAYFCVKSESIDEFKTQLKTTERFLKRAQVKVQLPQFEYYENFLLCVASVFNHNEQVRYPDGIYDIIKKRCEIKITIQDTTPVFYKQWLLENLL